MTGDRASAVFADVADEVGRLLRANDDWGLSGRRVGQYAVDVAVDEVVLALLHGAGFAVLSEESGRTGPDGAPLVVVDPLDGSTNASRGIGWYATALCLVDEAGPAVALVANQVTGERFEAVRGRGAWSTSADGSVRQLRPSTCTALPEAIVGVSGVPDGEYGWAQFRALGAAALDLCLVASGALDAYVDMSHRAHGVWDYLAAALVCAEAGAVVVDALGEPLTALAHDARRTPVAAATPELLQAVLAVRVPGLRVPGWSADQA